MKNLSEKSLMMIQVMLAMVALYFSYMALKKHK